MKPIINHRARDRETTYLPREMKIIMTTFHQEDLNKFRETIVRKYVLINMSEDEWDIFGSEDENEPESADESNVRINVHADQISIHLIQRFVKIDPSISMNHRYIGLPSSYSDEESCSVVKCISKKLHQSQFHMSIEEGNSNDVDAALIVRVFDASKKNTFDDALCKNEESSLRKRLALGGYLIMTSIFHNYLDFELASAFEVLKEWKTECGEELLLSEHVWETESASIIHKQIENGVVLVSIGVMKRPALVNTLSCKWKTNSRIVPSSYDDPLSSGPRETWLQYERKILKQATVAPSAYEVKESFLTANSIDKAVKSLQTHGFVILPRLFQHPHQIEMIKQFSNAFLNDFDSAVDILKKKYDIDVLHPGQGSDPLSYKEMAMREDFRVDLRDGQSIREARYSQESIDRQVLEELGYFCLDKGEGTMPAVIDSKTTTKSPSSTIKFSSLRYNPFVLEIIRKLLNPPAEESPNLPQDFQQPLYKGNYGRWNFSGAESGPTGLPMPLRVGQLGSVISINGAADQCCHADTSHIFEIHDCLPCHYANLFILGEDNRMKIKNVTDQDGNFTGENLIGGTAFVDGSHRLSVTARLTADDGISAAGLEEHAQNEMHLRTLRPSLQIGDALIFDTRTLHFGLANQSENRRPMLYVNMTHSWFFDPKNWDNKQSIFD